MNLNQIRIYASGFRQENLLGLAPAGSDQNYHECIKAKPAR